MERRPRRNARDAHLRDVGPRPAERIADDEQLIRAADGLVKGLGQGAAAGVMDVDHRAGELVRDGVRLGDRAAGPGGAVAKEFGERRLARPAVHHAAEAGEMFADGAGEDRAAAALPVEVGGADHDPLDVVFFLRQDAVDDLRADAEFSQRGDGRGKRPWRTRERMSPFGNSRSCPCGCVPSAAALRRR